MLNLFIAYELWTRDSSTEFTLGDCLFGAVKLPEHVHPDKCGYSDYGNGFDARSQLSVPNGEWGKNVVILGVDNIFPQADN